MPKYIDRDALIASMRGKKPIDWFNAVYDAPYFETPELLIEEYKTVEKCVKLMEENDNAEREDTIRDDTERDAEDFRDSRAL